jgi:hypothetical protein
MNKRCTKCGAEHPATTEFFYAEKRNPSGLRPVCKKCSREFAKRLESNYREGKKQWKKLHPDVVFESRMKERGIDCTWERYSELVREQVGLCAICGKIPDAPEFSNRKCERALFVDHDHQTKKPRGLLCSRCNFALGKFGEDVERLQQAVFYLEQHRC